MGLRDYFGKNEGAAISFVCGILGLIILIAMLSYYLPWGSTYESIEVSYAPEGQNLVVSEQHVQDLKGENFNVIYRSFAEDICAEGESCTIRIKSVSCSKGEPYYASRSGKAINPANQEAVNVGVYSYKIQANEVGCFDTAQFRTVKAELSVEYLVPMSHVESNQNKHIIFSDDHFHIQKLSTKSLDGSLNEASNIPANAQVSAQVTDGSIKVGGISILVALILGLAVVSIPYFIWRIFGTEKNFMVPAYMHTIPDKNRTAWEVDVLTNGTQELSKNGMASILMELYAKKIIRIQEEKKFMRKKTKWLVAKKRDLNGISGKAQDFLHELLKNKEGEDAKYEICELKTSSIAYTSFIKGFYKGSDVTRVKHEFFDNKGKNFFFLLTILLFFFIYTGRAFLSQGLFIIVMGLVFVFFIVSKMIPTTVFSRFKGDHYKNYLEWMAFKKMLQDYAQMKKYFKEDSVMWKEWLIYATALGAAENVLKQLKELKLLSPQEYNDTRLAHTYMMAWAISSYGSAHPKSSGSGGIGGGGGFGGGGGGGR